MRNQSRVFLLFWLIPMAFSLCSKATVAATGAGEEIQTELEGISVSGSNEQPQVLYIVPWQPLPYQNRTQHPPNKILSGLIKPIEPTFHKEDYHFRKKLEVKVQALNNRK